MFKKNYFVMTYVMMQEICFCFFRPQEEQRQMRKRRIQRCLHSHPVSKPTKIEPYQMNYCDRNRIQ